MEARGLTIRVVLLALILSSVLFAKEGNITSVPLECIDSNLAKCQFLSYDRNKSIFVGTSKFYRERNIAKPINALLQYDIPAAMSDLSASFFTSDDPKQSTIDTFLAMQGIPSTLDKNNALEFYSDYFVSIYLKGFELSYKRSTAYRIHFVADPLLTRFIVNIVQPLEWNPITNKITTSDETSYNNTSMINGMLNNKHYVNIKGINLDTFTLNYPMHYDNLIVHPMVTIMVAKTYNENLNLLKAVAAYTHVNSDEEIAKLLSDSYIQQFNIALGVDLFYKSTIEDLYITMHANNLNLPSFRTNIATQNINLPLELSAQAQYEITDNISSITYMDFWPKTSLIEDMYLMYVQQQFLWQPISWLQSHVTMKQNLAYWDEGFIVGMGLRMGEQNRFIEFSFESSLVAEKYNPIYEWLPILPRYAAFSLRGNLYW